MATVRDQLIDTIVWVKPGGTRIRWAFLARAPSGTTFAENNDAFNPSQEFGS